jgi:hypothetical protein
VPGLEDASPLERLAEVQRAIMGAANAGGQVASRYRKP